MAGEKLFLVGCGLMAIALAFGNGLLAIFGIALVLISFAENITLPEEQRKKSALGRLIGGCAGAAQSLMDRLRNCV